MKIRFLLVLMLAVLAVAACGSQIDTATTVPDASPEAAATAAVGPTAAPAAGQAITSTTPTTPTGGVEVALAAIVPVDGPLATVNGEEITWAEFEPQLNESLHSVTLQYGVDWNQADNIAKLGEFQDQILQTVVDRTVTRQYAAREGITASPEALQAHIEERKASILATGQFGTWEQFLEQYGLTEEYFARLMEDDLLAQLVGEAHGPSRETEQVHARHILVADEETGRQVLARLEAGEEWAALASELSQDTSNKDNAGDLGWFPRGVMVGPFEEAAFTLEPGTTSDLVQTDFGYHIIQVLEKGVREMDDDTYARTLSQTFQTWLDEQKAAAEIEIVTTFGAKE